MTKIEQLQKQITNLQKQSDDLQKQLDELKPPKDWPQKGDKYFTIVVDGEIFNYTWDNHSINIGMKKQGRVFRTQAEAERARDREALIAELRERAGHYAPALDGTAHKYYLYFDTENKKWFWRYDVCIETCPRSGYFAAPIDGLIGEFGNRLNLLRD